MKRFLLTLCLAICCLVPLHADHPADSIIEPAIDFPVQPDFASTASEESIGKIGSGCPVKVNCGGGVTIQCTGVTCTKVPNQCVACTHSKGVIRQFCPGTTGTTCNGTIVDNKASSIDSE
ncbi:MAG: hypothetical protein AAGE94_00555 [Acidobacteriota bacterium]